MRYRNRKPYKVTATVLGLLVAYREQGKSYGIASELAGIGKTTGYRYLKARGL